MNKNHGYYIRNRKAQTSAPTGLKIVSFSENVIGQVPDVQTPGGPSVFANF